MSAKQVIIALGANIPFSHAAKASALARATGHIAQLPGMTRGQMSALYRSPAWPDPSQPAYLNAVATFQSILEPAALLKELQTIEAEAGRARDPMNQNTNRPLDLDIVAYGDTVSPHPWRLAPKDHPLVIPHPRMHLRAFVLKPLATILPDWQHPVLGRSVTALLGDIAPDERESVTAYAPQ